MVKETESKVMKACPNCMVPGSDGRMPIVGFNAPIRAWHSSERAFWGFTGDFWSTDFVQERICKLIAESGVNLITHFENDYVTHPKDFHKILKWAEKYDFKVFVNDKGLLADMSEEELEARISEYGKYKSFAGIKIVDEPCCDGFPVQFEGAQKLQFQPMPNFAPISRRLNAYDNLIGYMNLLPYYYWMECGIEAFRKYLREYVETCNPKIISYDFYPFDDKDRNRAFTWFFLNLSEVRGAAKKYDLPFWTYVQCGSQWNIWCNNRETEEYRPTKFEFFWNVNVVLAFGAQGIEYFPLIQPYGDAMYLDGGLDCDRAGIIGADGEPTMWHVFVKRINKQIRAVDTVLMQSENVGVLAFGEAQKYVQGLDAIINAEGYKELVSVKCRKQGVFVGCFDYQGRTAFYVVNNDTKKCQYVTLNFDKIYDLEMHSYVGEKTEHTDTCKITLGAGNAILIVVSDGIS